MFRIWQVAFCLLASGKNVCYVQNVQCCQRQAAQMPQTAERCTGIGPWASGRSELKIEINVDENIEDTHIVISCKKLTPEMEKLLAMLHILEKQLAVQKGEETCFLDVSEVVYIESVDRKSFIYTLKEVYESDFKLYELEQQLEPCGFFRASKSSLIQLKYIKSLRADINRRIKVTLESGEQLIVSRQYAEELKRRLGLKV